MTSYLRYKQQIRTVQDADDAEIESWITVRGNHIPIKKGQSKEEAVKSFLKGKGESSSGKSESLKESASVPEDYKKSVAHYSPEKHAEAANFYGEKMASVQKKANSQTDPNASVYAKQFKEYQELSHWHEEQSKKEKYDPEFETVRKNALANGNVYGDVYTKERKEETKKPESSKKWSNWGKKSNNQPTSYQIEEAFKEVGLGYKWEHVKYRLDMHGIDQYTVKEFIDSGLFQPEDIIEALESRKHDKIDNMVKAVKKQKK